ncbi:hypothetical protein AKJ09_10859 [Labilithrix luteola]|uniref:SnoaL-like domain-containing protein n=1 Tax=Labilithrix luteola TaxID=1391654 RepID=A0A0K1QEK6_9BACT|nr:nuclear transport factor 2 family protein [Labilithrix luteola]AKV04196.1 hypothetical protein AKJ09_10859 [Labilithrix luteola]
MTAPRDVWQKAVSFLPTYDIDGYAACFHEDGCVEFPFAPPGLPKRIEGRDGILKSMGPLWRGAKAAGRKGAGMENVVVHETHDPEVVIIEFDAAREDANGTYRLSYVHVVRVRDGKIVSLRDYVDSWAISQALRGISSSTT